ncbi:hypothetical protein K1719_022140 [Acacia pycnantha]|nr:hypothetical protein K1719_022140 [Acacia pycnantha]
MGSSQVCFCWHKYRQLILYLLILFAPTSVFTHNAFMAEGRPISGLIKANKKGVKVQGEAISKNAKIGSRPPKCERRCRICGHCEAVQVPVVPQVQSHLSHSAVSETPIIAFSRTDDLSNYKPMSWKSPQIHHHLLVKVGREIYVETMLKQLAGRNQRAKGFKNEYEQNSRKTLEKLQFQHETPKLGRKGFQPRIKKPEDLTDDAEEIMPEKIKVRGGGNDEMNGHDQDKMEEEDSEEVEDLIDEEDKERIEEIEEEEGEDMLKNIEDISSLKDKSHDEGENENSVSRVMMRKTQSSGVESEGSLKSSENTEMVKQQNKTMAACEVLGQRTESIPKVEDKMTVVNGSLQTVLAKGKDDMPDFYDSEAGSSSDSLLRMEMTEPGSYHNSARILMEATADENEKASYFEKRSTSMVKKEKFGGF